MTTNEEILKRWMDDHKPLGRHSNVFDKKDIYKVMSLARQDEAKKSEGLVYPICVKEAYEKGAKDEAKKIFTKLEKEGFGDNTKLGYERFRQLKKECGVETK